MMYIWLLILYCRLMTWVRESHVGFCCIYNYLCNQCLSPLTLWVQIPLRRGVLNTILCGKICQCLAAGRWFSRGTLNTWRNQMTNPIKICCIFFFIFSSTRRHTNILSGVMSGFIFFIKYQITNQINIRYLLYLFLLSLFLFVFGNISNI
jgi:hypothetical protein